MLNKSNALGRIWIPINLDENEAYGYPLVERSSFSYLLATVSFSTI
jgi:hypothetical protein